LLPNDQSIDVGLTLARQLFDKIGEQSFDGTGYTRAAYGEGEQRAHDAVAKAAKDLGLKIEVDAALNMSMTLEGTGSGGGPLLIGSHLDSVPRGGNYDGLAGVLAGLATVSAYREAGSKPKQDITVMAIRAEESAWFGAQHIGSRAILGTLDPAVLDSARRVDSGRTLRDHMLEAGADPTTLVLGRPLLDLGAIRGYVELHIEQGPTLVTAGKPVGVVTGIRGNRRCRKIACAGEYGHSGTVPRSDRHDSVFAASELITRLDDLWRVIEEEGGDMVLTFGRFSTDPAAHAVTTVPGHVDLCFDLRSHSEDVLIRVEAALLSEMRDIGERRGVAFTHDPMTGDIPIDMDRSFQDAFERGCEVLSIPMMPIASGAGHDAGDFATAGVPTSMLFVRNENGSHNPAEHMEFDDFEKGVRLIAWFVAEMSEGRV